MHESAPNNEPEKFKDSRLFYALMENISDSIYFKDLDCRLVRVSQKMASSVGNKDPQDIIGKTDIELFGKEFGEKTRIDDLSVMQSGKPIIGLVEGLDKGEGKTNWTSTSKHPLRDENGVIFGLLGITREINELKQKEDDLQFMATHDVLTSLPNRFLLFDRFDQAIHRAKRYKTLLAVLYIDIDNFKKINDTFGHATGDLILVQIANTLKTHVRDLDTVARIGGDEFILLMESVLDEEEVSHIAQRIVDDIHQNIKVHPTDQTVTVSIGISLFPTHAFDSAKLLGCADDAMYKAKQLKNGYRLYVYAGK
ncbi:MAG TPA: GGDEF domain-containing protein [Leptolinea sp.]